MKINKRILDFTLGVMVITVGPKLLKSRCFKKAAVEAVVKGMEAKEYVETTAELIRENVDDIVAEAKVVKENNEERQAAEESCKMEEEQEHQIEVE